MKILFSTIILSLLLSLNANTEIVVREETRMLFQGMSESGVNIVCIDGYKFIIARAPDSIAVTQIFEKDHNKTLPAEC